MKYKINLAFFFTLISMSLVSAQSTDQLISGFMGPFSAVFGAIKAFGFAIMIGVPIIAVIGTLGYFFWIRPKMYNLTVIFNMIRSDGRVVNVEIGRGNYDSKKGKVILQRPGIKNKYEMKTFDIKKYIYGTKFLQVAQVGANSFVPIHPDSLTKYVGNDGNEQYFIDFKADITDQLLWGESFKLRAKNAFTIMDFLKQHETAIALGFVILAQAISTAFLIAVVN